MFDPSTTLSPSSDMRVLSTGAHYLSSNLHEVGVAIGSPEVPDVSRPDSASPSSSTSLRARIVPSKRIRKKRESNRPWGLSVSDRVFALSILQADPDISPRAFAKAVSAHIPSAKVSNIDSLHGYNQRRTSQPKWLHDLLVANRHLAVGNMSELVSLTEQAYAARSRGGVLAIRWVIPEWLKYCIEPLFASPPLSPPPCAPFTYRLREVVRLSLPQRSILFADVIHALDPTYKIPPRVSPTRLPSTDPLPPTAPSDDLSMGDMVQFLRICAANPDARINDLIDTMLARNPSLDREKLRRIRGRYTARAARHKWLHDLLLSIRHRPMEEQIREVTNEHKKRRAPIYFSIEDNIREWDEFCLSPLLAGVDPPPCELLVYSGSSYMRLSAVQKSKLFYSLVRGIEAAEGVEPAVVVVAPGVRHTAGLSDAERVEGLRILAADPDIRTRPFIVQMTKLFPNVKEGTVDRFRFYQTDRTMVHPWMHQFLLDHHETLDSGADRVDLISNVTALFATHQEVLPLTLAREISDWHQYCIQPLLKFDGFGDPPCALHKRQNKKEYMRLSVSQRRQFFTDVMHAIASGTAVYAAPVVVTTTVPPRTTSAPPSTNRPEADTGRPSKKRTKVTQRAAEKADARPVKGKRKKVSRVLIDDDSEEFDCAVVTTTSPPPPPIFTTTVVGVVERELLSPFGEDFPFDSDDDEMMMMFGGPLSPT